ncbi:MAG TPA: regulatory iron-sulfur-containing complex subunit RicT [Phycisphaerae bacterium]|nr:regulatory iron-sulfur-containing complex subunit RicT [Phycisphaerae bacterium]
MSDATPPADDPSSATTPDEPHEQRRQPPQPEKTEPQHQEAPQGQPEQDEHVEAQQDQASEETEPAPETPEPQVEVYEPPVGQEGQPAQVEVAPEQLAEEERQVPTVVARYGLMRHLGAFRCNWRELPKLGERVVLRTDRGVDLGQVIARVGDGPGAGFISRERLDAFIAANGPEYPFRRTGKVLRSANQQDIIDYRHLESSASEEAAFCREQMRQLQLDMKLVSVEHLLGGERIIFYFTAATRVDFRELVKNLAKQYHTRIEMRQVGSRDEARLVADFERCGRRCCCQAFLKYLQPVSMRMAKTQKATLDPAKISGRCGRLMCCLRYEDEGYEELRKKLPRKNTWVRTKDHVGRVIDVHILTQLVQLVLPDEKQVVVANEEIIERGLSGPPEAARPAVAAAPLARVQPAAAEPAPGEDLPAEDTQEQGEPEAVAPPAAEEPPHAKEGPDQLFPRRKRHRRRRRRRGPSGPPQGPGGPGAGGPTSTKGQGP